MYGEAINNTGVTQELVFIAGTFYDAQGQLIADSESTYDYWPVGVIPPAGRVPFELTVVGIQNAARYELSVEAEPVDRTPRQDFGFSELSESDDGGEYCVAGRLNNPGSAVQDYLAVVLILFDGQDRVVNFGEEYDPLPESVVGNETWEFVVCTETFDQQVARYELRAWGR